MTQGGLSNCESEFHTKNDKPFLLGYIFDIELHFFVREDKQCGVLLGGLACDHRFIGAAGV